MNDPLDKAFPPNINDEVLSVLEDILEKQNKMNDILTTICRVISIYAEANPPKGKRKVKDG